MQNPLVHIVVDFERILKVVQQSFQFTLFRNIVTNLVLGHEHQSSIELLNLQ